MSEDNKNNIIDFTVIRLKKLSEDYKRKQYLDAAKQIDDCLEAYLSGDVTVIWKDGLPYVKLKDKKAQDF